MGESILFDAGASVDPDGTIVSWSWDFGDGASADTEQVSHAFAASGVYLVRLTVTDDGGAVGQDVAMAYVVGGINQPPVADAGGNQRVDLGSPVLLNGAGSSDPDGTIESHEWDLGDGNTATGAAVEHTFVAAGSYLVELTVTDDKGATDEDSILVTVEASGSGAGCGCAANESGSRFGTLLWTLLLGLAALRRRPGRR